MANTTSKTIEAKFDGDTTGLAAAAKRAERIVEKVGDNTGRSFDRGFNRWFRGRGGRQFSDLGSLGGRIFGSGLLRGFATPGIGPILLATLLAVVATVMPLVGAAAAGAFIFAFGLGLAGIGLVFAAQSEKVKAAFKDLAADLGADMRLISAPFEATWLSIAATARRVFAGFVPALAMAFIALAEPITTFADDVGTAFLELEPTIAPITRAFTRILEELGPALAPMFESVADAIITMADSIAANPDTFVMLIGWLFAIVAGLIRFLAWLNDVAGWFEDHPQMTRGLQASLGALGDAFGAVSDAISTVIGWMETADRAVFGPPHTADMDADPAPFFKSLNRVGDAASKWGRSAFKATLGAIVDVFKALNDAINAGQNWAGRTFNATFGAAFGAFGSGGGSRSGRPGRADGGPVSAFQTYLVGERGPELLTMGSTGGHVTPNHQLPAAAAGDIQVRVFIGDQELKGMVRTEISGHDRRVKRAVTAGAGRVV